MKRVTDPDGNQCKVGMIRVIELVRRHVSVGRCNTACSCSGVVSRSVTSAHSLGLLAAATYASSLT